jgi:AraC family transcriptional regulator of adaptative response/methylated-DNA-[protein]-cysteine methyltransferase
VVARLCRLLETDEPAPSLELLAREAQWSPFHLHRVFKRITGLTPKAYAAAHRGRRVQQALSRSGSVTEAIYDAGYNSGGRFYADAPKVLGMTPTRYRAGGADTEARFAVGQCSLGAILVARSDVGVCAILIGDDPDALTRDLQDRFPRATLVGGDAGFEQWVAKVVGFVEAPALGLDLPLDVRGTAFQQRVWQALQAIPPGHTASYSEIARRIGAPRSVRESSLAWHGPARRTRAACRAPRGGTDPQPRACRSVPPPPSPPRTPPRPGSRARRIARPRAPRTARPG